MIGELVSTWSKNSPSTTAYHIKRPTEHNSKLIYFIPGNPGLAEYYIQYLDEIHHQLPGYEIYCPSHIGFDTTQGAERGNMADHVYTLDDQLSQKIEILNRLCEGATSSSPRQVIIMGHSVGSWMAQRVVVESMKNENIKIELVGLITPTIQDIAQSDKGKFLIQLGSYLSSDPGWFVGKVSQLLYWATPNMVLQFLLKLGMKFPPQNAVDATMQMLTRPNIVQQFLTMGSEEMDRIKKEPGEDIKNFWDNDNDYRVWMFFVQKDHWIKEETKIELIEKYGNLKHVILHETKDPNIQHAFCVRDYNIMATNTVNIINGNY